MGDSVSSWSEKAVGWTRTAFTVLIPFGVAFGASQQTLTGLEDAIVEGLTDAGMVGGALILSVTSIYHQVRARFEKS